MFKWVKASFWNAVAGLILRNRITFLIIIALITGFLAFQWKNIRFTFTEANMLPDDHPVNVEYKRFLSKFGEEGNLILLAINYLNFNFCEIQTCKGGYHLNGLKVISNHVIFSYSDGMLCSFEKAVISI